MPEALPVTDEDVRAAWDVSYTSGDYEAIAPNPNDRFDEVLLRQIRAMLENDRARVIDRST